jgi:hypothetical protein
MGLQMREEGRSRALQYQLKTALFIRAYVAEDAQYWTNGLALNAVDHDNGGSDGQFCWRN